MNRSYACEKFGLAVDILADASAEETYKLSQAFRQITAITERDFEDDPYTLDQFKLLRVYQERADGVRSTDVIEDLTSEQIWAVNGLFFRIYRSLCPAD